MAKTREKKVVVSGVTADQMESAFADFSRADAKSQKIIATMDVEMNRIREKYREELLRLQEEKESSFNILLTYAKENRDTLFTKKKSVETVHGVMGFRIGNPELKPQKGFTWASVLNLLKEFLPSYVRTKEEPDKERLLADRTGTIKDPNDSTENEGTPMLTVMSKCGISVVQKETFYVEPKKEEID